MWDLGYPFSKEKLSPVLSYYVVKDEDEGIDTAERLIEFGGLRTFSCYTFGK